MNSLKHYEKRIQAVCDYIYHHLDEELTLEVLSEVAHFSKHHFHRQFSHYMGMGLFKFIQQIRLKRAAFELVFQPEKRITDIALDAKFDYPESFSRAFKKVFSQSPSDFRQRPDWPLWHQHYQRTEKRVETTMEVTIKTIENVAVAVLEHRGSPDTLMESAGKFINWRKSTGLSPISQCRTFGIVYDDPDAVAPEAFRFDIAGEVFETVAKNETGILNKSIAGGRYAVVRHIGSHDDVGNCLHYLYGKWLPNSGEELRDAPCFFHWQNFFPEVPEHELITDVYLPLK